MKHKGLLNTPKDAFSLLVGPTESAMKKLNESAVGRTTNGKPVRLDLYYGVMYGFENRAGEIAPQVNVWVFGYGQAQNGKHYAVDSRSLYRAQKSMQGAWHSRSPRSSSRAGDHLRPPGQLDQGARVPGPDERSQQVNASSRRPPSPARPRGPGSSGRPAPPNPRSPGPKRVKNFAYTATDRMEQKLRAFSAWRQERLAEGCRQGRLPLPQRAGAARFSAHEVYATGAAPGPAAGLGENLRRAFDRLMKMPERMVAEVAKLYPDGNTLFMPRAQLKLEKRAGMALRERGPGPQGRADPARCRQGPGREGPERDRVRRRAADRRQAAGGPEARGGRGPEVDPAHGRGVQAEQEARLRGREAGGHARSRIPAYSHFGFAEKLDRTPHLKALWQGLRTKGTLKERLGRPSGSAPGSRRST